MAKKHKKPSIQAPLSRTPIQPGGANLLQEALRNLRRGNFDAVLTQAAGASRTIKDPATSQVAQELQAEAYFRKAMLSEQANQRLQHLDAALKHAPNAPRLHFHRGIVLWQLERLPEAVTELDTAAHREPQRPGLAYLRQLAHLAAGQPWDAAGLSPAEANTLRLIQGLVQPEAPAQPLSITEPLLGKGTEMWQALAEMRSNPAVAPGALLKVATDQNARKPISRLLHYYRGVAAMRQEERDVARAAWLTAQAAGLATPWLDDNLTALLRQQAVELAQEGRWQEVVTLIGRLSPTAEDRILAETAGLAYYHLGYAAAQEGKWQAAVEQWRKAEKLDGNRYVAQNLALAEEALNHWTQAAEAWRDMVRRRPRKADHPDYLTDVQVAALWSHAAECYEKTDDTNEIVVCLKNAVKHAPDDAALRLRLVDMLMELDRGDSAETELLELLELEPQNVEALTRLASLYEGWWDRDPAAIWKRVLAANPEHAEAREALADKYIEKARAESPRARFLLFGGGSEKEKIKLLEEGLQELPGHPKLLLELGTLYVRANNHKQGRAYLLQAYHAAPGDTRIVSSALHELLHARAGDAVEELLPAVRQIEGLLPGFWLDQGQMVLGCKLDEAWAVRFFDEAVALAGRPWVQDTLASLLLQVYEVAYEKGAKALARSYQQRIQTEVPNSGAVEYLEAHRLHHEELNVRAALNMLRKAIQIARRANDTGVLKLAEGIQSVLTMGAQGLDFEAFLRQMMR
jgi:tetratricopeptide (TPR) repeat protein